MRKYSIIIPIYNAADFLEECLDSVVRQTYRNIEILLINDGSTDNSVAIAQKLADSDERIRLVTKQNEGVSVARNNGIELATGDYILFVDADDYLMNNMAIEKIDQKISKNAHSLLFFNICYEGNSKKNASASAAYLGKSQEKVLHNLIAREDMNSPCNKVYSNKIIKKYRLKFNKNIRIAEDLLFNIEYIQHCNKIEYLDETLYFYRTSNQNSLTSSYYENKYDDLMYVNGILLEWSSDLSNSIQDIAYVIRLKNILSCVKDLRHKNCHLTKFEKLRRLARYASNNPSIALKVHSVGYMLSVIAYTYIDVKIITMIVKTHRWS